MKLNTEHGESEHETEHDVFEHGISEQFPFMHCLR